MIKRWINRYLAATFCQMLGHPGRLHGCSVPQVQGLGYPDHWAECSAALLLSTPSELSMPVPGQPNPLDLHKKHKMCPLKIQEVLATCTRKFVLNNDRLHLRCMRISYWPGSCWCWKDCIHCCWLRGHCGQGCPPWSHITIVWGQTWVIHQSLT